MDIKYPQRKDRSKVERALDGIPQDGQPHRLFEMGFTSAEQTARGLNAPGSTWDFGYTHETKDGVLISVLWARYNMELDKP